MTIEPWAVGVLLLAALTHALWNAVVKSSGDRLFALTTIMAAGGAICAPLLFVTEPPAPESWPFLAASVVVHLVYYLGLSWAYAHGDLSTAYPVARGAAPLMVAIGAAVFAGQILSPVASTGIVVTSVGISMFAFENGLPRRATYKPFLSAFFVSTMIATYTVIDGMGLRRTPDPLAYIAWLFVIDAIPLFVWALVVRHRAYVEHLRTNWRREVVGGALSVIAYGMVLYILSFSGMAMVSALRETSVLFAVAIGAIRLKETFGAYRWIAAFVVTAGIIVMNVGG
ncbi:MAG: EamA family transporter [Rhodospirillales bacterium]